MSQSAIEWTDVAHTVVRGCSPASAGCLHCYAARLMGTRQKHLPVLDGAAKRGDFVDVKLIGKGRGKNYVFNGRVELDRDALAKALTRSVIPSGSRCFWNHLSDTFHETLSDAAVAAQWAVMAARPDVTFIVLTKRSARAAAWFRAMAEHPSGDHAQGIWEEAAYCLDGSLRDKVEDAWRMDAPWPMPNIWLGVSAEDQATANARIPHLLECHAVLHWVSYEPALGPVDFSAIQFTGGGVFDVLSGYGINSRAPGQSIPNAQCQRLGWVVAGAESGPGARPANLDWFRSVRAQCSAAGVPYFLKQADICKTCDGRGCVLGGDCNGSGSTGSGSTGKVRKGNPALDGHVWAEMPTTIGGAR